MPLDFKPARLMRPKEDGPYEIKITSASLKNAFTFIDRFALALTVKDKKRVSFTDNALSELKTYKDFSDKKNLEMLDLLAGFPNERVQEALSLNMFLPLSTIQTLTTYRSDLAQVISKRNMQQDVLEYLFKSYVESRDENEGHVVAVGLASNECLPEHILVSPALNYYVDACIKVINHTKTPSFFIESLLSARRHSIHIAAVLRLINKQPENVTYIWRINKCIDECDLSSSINSQELVGVFTNWFLQKKIKLVNISN